MQSISRYMTDDHNHCDDLFADAENAVAKGDWQTGTTQFQAFETATLKHFEREENILFPAFEAGTGMYQGPTTVMRSEHVDIRDTMQGMLAALGRKDADAYLGLSETLLMLLRQHNLKEEQILYPMADQALAASIPEVVRQMAVLEM